MYNSSAPRSHRAGGRFRCWLLRVLNPTLLLVRWLSDGIVILSFLGLDRFIEFVQGGVKIGGGNCSPSLGRSIPIQGRIVIRLNGFRILWLGALPRAT